MSSPELAKKTEERDSIQVRKVPPRSFQARLLKIRMFLGSRVFYPKYVATYTMRLDPKTHLKLIGRSVLEQEAKTIHFVATHTTIPVPRIHQLLSINGCRYLIMEHVKGQRLNASWIKMSEPTKAKVVDQLRDYITQLRSLTPPRPELVASVSGGPIWEPARVGYPLLGPFATHDDFHLCLRGGFPLSAFKDSNMGPWTESVFRSHSQKYETKFTHGDLAGRNILCKADGTITCILDWETSGWYPEYWEYTKAHYFPSGGEDWTKRIGLITGEYPEQLVAEANAQEYIEPWTEPFEDAPGWRVSIVPTT